MKAFRTLLLSLCSVILSAGLLLAAVDLNKASSKDLEALKGIGPATAKKIIAARPYASVGELSKAGLSARQIADLQPLVMVAPAAAPAAAPKVPKAAASKAPAVPAGPVELNTVSQKDLEALKGIGPATAKKIIAARPYGAVAELSKAGMSPAQIAALGTSVTVAAHAAAPVAPIAPAPKVAPAAAAPKVVAPAAAAAAPAPAAPAAAPVAAKTVAPKVAPVAPGAPLDLNKASEKDLEALKGIGPVTAAKIIAARPYHSVDELSKAGVSAKVLADIRSQVMVAVAPAAATTKAAAAHAPTLAQGQIVNINTAPLETLELLPGIGPVKAQAIIAARPYAAPEDIMKVKGIKEGEFAKIKGSISVR